MLEDGILVSLNDVLEKEGEAILRGRFIGNTGDDFYAMNQTQVVGRNCLRGSWVVMNFWGAEEAVDGNDVEDGVSGEEKDASDDKYKEEKRSEEEEEEKERKRKRSEEEEKDSNEEA